MSTEEDIQGSKENIETETTEVKPPIDVEKEQEAKLRSKYPALRAGPGGSSFLQKRISKGQKFFDSGDYNMNMAKKKMGPPSNIPPHLSAATASSNPGKVPAQMVPPGTTGDVIPTPETVPLRKTSIAHLKHLS